MSKLPRLFENLFPDDADEDEPIFEGWDQDFDNFDDGDPEPPPELGPCCGCGKVGPTVRLLAFLPWRLPEPGGGWACLVCGLPPEGAMAVMCEECEAAGVEPIYACVGYPKDGARVPISSLTEPFDHDLSKHPELEGR